MAKALFTLLLALLISAAVATPIKPLRKRSFKVPRYENKNFVPNGKVAMKRAYLKFGLGDIESKPNGEVATRIQAASNNTGNDSGSEDGETPATGTQNDAQFLSPVTVGGQQLIMNFDSGSSDTWVFSTNLNARSQRGHTIFDPKKSTTFQASKNRFNISYGDGSACSGPVGFDTVDIGGSTVQNQAIGLPNIVSPSFVTGSAANGLVGLAFSKLNTVKPQQQKTFFDNIVDDLTEPVFTAQLKGGTVGAYEFGQVDTTAFKGSLANVPVDDTLGFWQFESQSAKVNDKVIDLKGNSAIADTGTSLMLVSPDFAQAYWDEAGGEFDQQQGGFIFPCNTKLPDLEVAVGPDYMATVPGVDLNFATVGRQNGTTMCFGGLQAIDGLNFAIYGDSFFKSQFVAFNNTGPTLGIAPHA